MNSTASDQDIVRQVREGDRESYGLLAVRHRRRLEGLARKLARSAAEAEDAVQGAHVLALSHFDQYQGRAPYVEWMSTITLNEVRTFRRRNRVAVHGEELRDSFADPLPTPEQWAIGRDIQRLVGRALDRIPPAYSAVFRLRAVAELSTAETCRRLGLTSACVKARLLRARSMLRHAIAPQLTGAKTPPGAARARSAFEYGGDSSHRVIRCALSCAPGVSEPLHSPELP